MEQNKIHENDFMLVNGACDDFDNSQFLNILKTALRRSSEAVRFFEIKGTGASKILNKAFFMYLAVKKEAQRTILQKMAESLVSEFSKMPEVTANEAANDGPGSSDEEYTDIFETIHEIAADELEFYRNYAAVEKSPRIKSFILMLADFSKEFLFDVQIWYLSHQDISMQSRTSSGIEINPQQTVQTILN